MFFASNMHSMGTAIQNEMLIENILYDDYLIKFKHLSLSYNHINKSLVHIKITYNFALKS